MKVILPQNALKAEFDCDDGLKAQIKALEDAQAAAKDYATAQQQAASAAAQAASEQARAAQQVRDARQAVVDGLVGEVARICGLMLADCAPKPRRNSVSDPHISTHIRIL